MGKRLEKSKKNRKAEHKKHLSATKIVLICLAAVLLILGGVAYHYYASFSSYLKGITAEAPQEGEPQEEPPKFGSTPLVVYLSGSDSRTTLSATARSDVNIVAVINPATSKILLVSIPRDYYVQLHGTTGLKDKLTHAGIYGIEMSKNTVADLLDIEIDETVKVGFDAVETVVDALDGIDLDVDQDFTARTNKSCSFTTGVQHVDGKCALAFSRERYAYTTGDRHRGQNQQQVITKAIKKASEPAYLLRLPKILAAADGLFETSFSYSELLDMIKYEVWYHPDWTVESISLDGSGAMLPTYSMGSQNLYVMIPDESTIAIAKEKIIETLSVENPE